MQIFYGDVPQNYATITGFMIIFMPEIVSDRKVSFRKSIHRNSYRNKTILALDIRNSKYMFINII